jgi:hypothetical protein
MKTQILKSMLLVFLAPTVAPAVGSWTAIINEPAGVRIEQMLLLSDGSVMAQGDNNGEANWWRLSPDSHGSYVNGSWTQLSSMHYARNAYGKLLLKDGRVMVAGDENDGNGGTAEIYDPLTDSWTVLSPPSVGFADCETVLLSDGTVLISPVGWVPYPQFVSVIYSPANNTWSTPTSSLAYQDEASWVKMPDNSILTIDINATTSERFIPSLTKWVADATVPVDIYSQGEMGPGFLLPDGRAFFLGGTGHTVLYTPSPSGGTHHGTWVQGPDIPAGRATADAPGVMMPNGKILCAVGPTAADGGSPAPTWFYEYDYTSGPTGSFAPTSSPGNSAIGSSNNIPSNQFSFLPLPDGTILCCTYSRNQLFVYQPDQSPLAAGKPTIYKTSWNSDGSLHVTGTLFNGISQGAAFGDEGQDASDYPIVRFNDGSGNVYYGRTYNWSSTSVQTGGAVVSTDVSLPFAIFNAPGTYYLQVIANGIASDPVTFFGPVWVNFSYSGLQFGTFVFPFATLAQGVNAVTSGGTVAINAGAQPSDSHETMTISKPMTITSIYGPSTIGH